MAEDQGKSGNRKLVPIVARHGGGLSDSYDYINISMQGEIGKVVENETKNELLLKNRKGKDGFDHQISDEEKPF